MKYGSKFILPYETIQSFQHHLYKGLAFPIELSQHPYRNSPIHRCLAFSGISVLFLWSICLSLCKYHVSWSMQLFVSTEVRRCVFSVSSVAYRMVLLGKPVLCPSLVLVCHTGCAVHSLTQVYSYCFISLCFTSYRKMYIENISM